MKLLLLTAAVMFVASAIPTDEWEQYKAKYQKAYTSEEEDLLRYNEYLKTKKMVEEHNIRFERGESSYSMDINHFSDWFPEEINHMLGTKPSKTVGKPYELPEGTPVPDSINWVEKGAVTSVKDQGDCGSCYAFSAIGALEALMFRTNKTITDISAQELVDCSNDLGCAGGWQSECFVYVKGRDGIDTEASYPYKAVQQKCRADQGVIGTTCTDFETLESEEDLTNVVGTVGPVSISFAASKSFVLYKSGVFDGGCESAQNHGMVAVGYGKDEETGKDYWLIKNSWGKKWGEKGYVRVIRNVNKCQLGDQPSYPVYSPHATP